MVSKMRSIVVSRLAEMLGEESAAIASQSVVHCHPDAVHLADGICKFRNAARGGAFASDGMNTVVDGYHCTKHV